MSNFKEFLKKKNVNFTVQAYLIDALGAMASDFSPRCSSEPSSTPWGSSYISRAST